jgi:hypothetical protein
MSFDCGNCSISKNDNLVGGKIFDLIISTDDNFHIGKYCNFDCLVNDVKSLSDDYKTEPIITWEIMYNDLLNFFQGGSDNAYQYLLPKYIVADPLMVDSLNNVFQKCDNPKMQMEILCYWISCVEPGGNWPNIKTFEEVKLPKELLNGCMIKTDNNQTILVTEAEPYNGEKLFAVKIKDQIHSISVANISFSTFSSNENVLI